MKTHFRICLLLSFIFPCSYVTAQVTCVSGQASQTNLILQMSVAKLRSPITDVIYKQYNLGASTEGKAECIECRGSVAKRPEDLAQVASAIEGVPAAPKLLFNPQCLRSSNTFDADASEVFCPEERQSKSKDICQTEEILTYQNATISSFLSCAKKLEMPTISPSTLYGIYSVESGFKPQYSSRSGLGMGQLTNIFVKDVHQMWRGGAFLEKIAKSDLKECEAAKILAQKDLNSQPKHSNACSFIQIGEGMERNILHTMIGLAVSWEKDISPLLKSYTQKYASDPALEEVKSLTMANAYGAGGRAVARAIANRLSGKSPEDYLQHIKKPMIAKNKKGKKRTLNNYTLKIAERQNKIAPTLAEPLRSAFEKQGAQACLNP